MSDRRRKKDERTDNAEPTNKLQILVKSGNFLEGQIQTMVAMVTVSSV